MELKGPLYLNRSRRKAKSTRFKAKSLLWLLVLVPMLWVAFREVRAYLEQPQAMLVLGGAPKREDFAAEFARQHPQLPIWISGGSNPEYTEAVFADAGIDLDRLHIDREAVDTVTNFTTLVDEFESRGIESVYLITSDYHMRRARIIGEIVFGSRGIHIKPVRLATNKSAEPLSKAVRDGARAIFWVFTGHTGSTLTNKYENR